MPVHLYGEVVLTWSVYCQDFFSLGLAMWSGIPPILCSLFRDRKHFSLL